MTDYEAPESEPDEDDLELAREDRDELVGDDDADEEGPQPWAKALPGDE
jgi:hypothetical protein